MQDTQDKSELGVTDDGHRVAWVGPIQNLPVKKDEVTNHR